MLKEARAEIAALRAASGSYDRTLELKAELERTQVGLRENVQDVNLMHCGLPVTHTLHYHHPISAFAPPFTHSFQHTTTRSLI